MRQIGVSQGFGLVAEQEHDVAGLGLRLEELAAQARAVHGVGVLAALQGVARRPPEKTPFLRSTTDSREREMRTPAHFSISSAKRGSVEFGRPATGKDKRSSATASAHSAFTGAVPGATDILSASTPPLMKALRHKRTVSSRTSKASAILGLVHPNNVGKSARAWSASPRSRDRLRANNAPPLLFARHNRELARHDHDLESEQTMESRHPSVGRPKLLRLPGKFAKCDDAAMRESWGQTRSKLEAPRSRAAPGCNPGGTS